MKTITITDDSYNEIKRVKKIDESFSQLLKRLARKEKVSITEFAGFLSEKTAREIKKSIKEARKIGEKLNREREKRLAKLWPS